MKTYSVDFKLVEKFVGSDHSYVRMYPDSKRLNFFSVSRLAWNVEDLVNYKLGKGKDEWNGKMMVGKILGKATQEEFVKQDPDWFVERPEVRYVIPFKWKNNPGHRDITLLGHPDLVNHKLRRLIELKTSVFDSKIHNYAKWQAGLYWAFLLKTTGHDYTTRIIKVSVPPNEETMVRKDKVDGAKVIISKAYQAARILDERNRNATINKKT